MNAQASQQDGSYSTDNVDDFKTIEYDFVIVGGGTAGLVLANRISSHPRFTVGVIEAGSNRLNDPMVDIPASVVQMTGNKDYDWHFVTTPQGPKGYRCHLPRGKMLGGSSGINWMVYTRPSTQDFDDWASLVGDPSWSAAQLKKYQKKHQTLEPLDDSLTERTGISYLPENHGLEGPIHTSFNTIPISPLEEAVYEAGSQASGVHTSLIDPWGGNHLGFYRSLGAVYRSGPHKGKRSYAARSYLEGILGRSNLHVLCNAHVTRILLQDSKAVGVEYDHSGRSHFVKAKREVLLSAGAIASPHLLQLSGIGSRAVLEKAGIECKIEVPGVGENLQEHPGLVTCYELKPGLQSGDALFYPEVLEQAMKQYTEEAAGSLASVGSVQGYAPIRPYLSDADVEEIIEHVKAVPAETPFQESQRELVLRQVRSEKSAFIYMSLAPVTVNAYAEGGFEDHSKIFPTSHADGAPHGFGFATGLQYIFSRGWVRATSSDPYRPPEINPNFMDHPADIVTGAAVLAFVQKFSEMPTIKDKIAQRTYPRETDYDFHEEADRREFTKEVWTGQYHLCGTCAMGDVLDTRLRVNGVQGLRVVDASVFPNHVSGNIMSSVYTVAEKAADLILEEYTS